MNRNAGWAAAVAFALAGAVGFSTLQPHSALEAPSPAQTREAVGQRKPDLPHKGTGASIQPACEQIEDLLLAFYSADASASVAPEGCIERQGASAKTSALPSPKTTALTNAVAHTHFIIATLPDPAHTHLSLMFDRFTDSIQQAAQDAGYTYDSSWLPWETEDTAYLTLPDQDAAELLKQYREDQPGVILFRRGVEDPAREPYRDALIVFVVGEEPTEGIHVRQFTNAALWIQALQPNRPQQGDTVSILGPTFSGSLPSVYKILSHAEPMTPNGPALAQTLQPDANLPLRIYSGYLQSPASAEYFIEKLRKLAPRAIDFRSFQSNGEEASESYYQFLDDLGLSRCGVAVISEDETAYGFQTSPVDSGNGTKPCADDPSHWAPPTFYYPRDISALRAAYQEQSLFSRPSSQSSAEIARRTLKNNLADPEGVQHDSIRSYAGSQTALSEESILLQVVTMLRAHHSQFLVIRSSNPMDQLFLAHFFKDTYPEGRIVLLGSDLLFRREVGSNGLEGILTLTNYPLLPDLDHWTSRPSLSHTHRAFPTEGAQGIFLALRFELNGIGAAREGVAPLQSPYKGKYSSFLPPNCQNLPVPNYAYPLWLQDRATCQVPAVWLSVLGRDGFLPVAALPSATTKRGLSLNQENSNSVRSFGHSLFVIWREMGFGGPALPTPVPWREVPLSMDVAVLFLLGWAFFHLVCCCSASFTVKPEHRAYFARPRRTPPLAPAAAPGPDDPAPSYPYPRSHILLIVLASATLVAIATTLAFGYGWMSGGPEPIGVKVKFLTWFPVIIWWSAFLSVAANAWVEWHLHQPEAALPFGWIELLRRPACLIHEARSLWKNKPARLAIALPLLLFAGLTAAYCTAFFFYIDSTLTPEVKLLTYLRSMDLTSGVSPALPVIVLLCGIYGWCWYSLRGVSLFGIDQPLLPARDHVTLQRDYTDETMDRPYLSILSHEIAAGPIIAGCWPFHRRTLRVALIAFATIIVGTALITQGTPLRSLGSRHYSMLISLWIAFSSSLLLANAWQLAQIWLRLQRLLVFVERLPLRRSMEAMRGFTWGSIWKIGGNVLDLRYKLVYRQIEALNHLSSALEDLSPLAVLRMPNNSAANIKTFIADIQDTHNERRGFSKWFAKSFDNWQSRDLASLSAFQKKVAKMAGLVLTGLLIPAWPRETDSLLNHEAAADGTSASPASFIHAEPYVRNAEEFVCLVYLGFIQNILGRIRSMVLGMTCVFLSIALVLPSYPFDPRPLITGIVFTLAGTVGAVVFVVYSQMFRDSTLSHLTNTKPGELGVDFWLKFVSFGIGPILGLLATLFPDFSNFFFSWLQPSLSSIK